MHCKYFSLENIYVTNPDFRQDLHTIFCGNPKTEKAFSTSLLLKAEWDCLNNPGVKFSSVSTLCIGCAVTDRPNTEESVPLSLGNERHQRDEETREIKMGTMS